MRVYRIKENKMIDRPDLLLNTNRDCEKHVSPHLRLPTRSLITIEIFEYKILHL